MDQALIHSSRPNLSDRPRVAAVAMLRAAEDGLVYYHRTEVDGEIRLQRFSAPADFHLRQELGFPPHAGELVGVEPERVAPHTW